MLEREELGDPDLARLEQVEGVPADDNDREPRDWGLGTRLLNHRLPIEEGHDEPQQRPQIHREQEDDQGQ